MNIPMRALAILGPTLFVGCGAPASSSPDDNGGGRPDPSGAELAGTLRRDSVTAFAGSDIRPEASGLAHGLTPNDVSILFPLTADTLRDDATTLVDSAERTPKGPILPSWIYAQAPKEVGDRFQAASSAGQLRAVSMRLDPCSNIANAPSDAACTPQLRIVWQPLEPAGRNVMQDRNIHAIYAVTRAEMNTMATALEGARVASGMDYRLATLAVQPAIVHEGLQGQYAQVARGLLRAYAGEANLSRIAIVSADPNAADTTWTFFAFDIHNGAATPSLPPGLPSSTETVGAGHEGEFARVSPMAVAKDNLAELLPPRFQGPSPSPESILRGIATSYRVEDPHVDNTDTITCATCHLAEQLRHTLTLSLSPGATVPQPTFTSPTWNLAKSTDDGSHCLQAFSYCSPAFAPKINQRVINESAMIADYLNLNYLAH